MMKKPGMISMRWRQGVTLTDVCQGSKSNPRCDDILPLDLLVVKEPPNILVGDNVTDVGPTTVEEGKEHETGKVATEWLQNVSLRARKQQGDICLLALMLLRKKTSKKAMQHRWHICQERRRLCTSHVRKCGHLRGLDDRENQLSMSD